MYISLEDYMQTIEENKAYKNQYYKMKNDCERWKENVNLLQRQIVVLKNHLYKNACIKCEEKDTTACTELCVINKVLLELHGSE